MNIIEKTQKIGYAKEVENIDTKNYNTIISTIIIEIIEMLLINNTNIFLYYQFLY
jgi:hypothetical protein